MVVSKRDLDAMEDNITEKVQSMLTKSIDELKNTLIDSLKKSNELLQSGIWNWNLILLRSRKNILN